MLVEFTDELVELEPHKRVVWHHSSPWNADTEYRVEGSDDATILHASFVAMLRGKLWLMDLMPDSWATNVFRRDMERLEKHLDSTAP